MHRNPTQLLALALVLVAATLSGCGASDQAGRALDDARDRVERISRDIGDLRQRADDLREQARRVGRRIRKRVERALEDLKQAVPAASLSPPTSDRANGSTEVTRFLDQTIASIDRYWTRTLTAAGRDEPTVSYLWVEPGARGMTGCRSVADDQSAFYCSADDTIYVGQRFATQLWEGVSRSFPGQAAGYGRAVGDFGLAYVVAHEYGHNLQQELGFFSARTGGGPAAARPFELQADCFAGNWANAVYREGRITDEDVQEALQTALAVGDFEYGDPQHHGTPQERRDAWALGFQTGDPSECARFLAG